MDRNGQNPDNFGENLSQRQLAALPYLIQPGPLSAKAKTAGIARSTLYNWMNDDNFRNQLQQLREETLRLAQSEFQGAAYEAALVMRDSLRHENEPARFRAAREIVNQAHKAQYGQDLERRLEALIEAIDLEKYSRRF